MTNREVQDYLDGVMPFASAEDWDNVGLLVGSPDTAVCGILVTLDVTPAAIAAAERVGANLIVSHHPVIFSPLKRLAAEDIVYRLAAAGIAVISVHTNLDKDSVNDVLAARLGLCDVTPTADGICRVGHLPQPLPAADFAAQVGAALATAVRTNGGGEVATVALCGGSGGDFLPGLVGTADAFVTGEVKHHEWLEANAHGLTVVEAGHYATEVPVVEPLAQRLAAAFPAVTVTAFADAAPYTTV